MSVQRLQAIWLLLLGLTPAAFADGMYRAERSYQSYFGWSGGISLPDLPSKAELDAQVLNGAPGTSSLDDTGSAWSAQVGYRWGSHVAAEVSYVDFGKTQYRAEPAGLAQEDSIRYLNSGVTLAALGMLPLGERFDLYARGGASYVDTRTRFKISDPASGASLASVENKVHRWSAVVGVGADWNIGQSFALRLDYQRFFDVGEKNATGQFDIDLLTLGVLFR